jgi:hypothetical protein
MAVELGKSGYEGEKDIAAQKEIYAAFLELMAEILKTVPGFNPRIDIQKGQGLTIERKAPGQAVEDMVEVEQKPLPGAVAKKPGIQTLYGVGQNSLTTNDIKAISAIIAGKQGDTVIGGEGLIIKYNGKTLFETDERGKISLHTAVSPQMRGKFAALQAGQSTPTSLPANTPSNEARQVPKAQETAAQSQVQEQIGSLFAKLVNSLPVVGVPKVPATVAPQPTNGIILPPNFNTEDRQANQEPIAPHIVADPLELLPPLRTESSLDNNEKGVEQHLEPTKTDHDYRVIADQYLKAIARIADGESVEDVMPQPFTLISNDDIYTPEVVEAIKTIGENQQAVKEFVLTVPAFQALSRQDTLERVIANEHPQQLAESWNRYYTGNGDLPVTPILRDLAAPVVAPWSIATESPVTPIPSEVERVESELAIEDAPTLAVAWQTSEPKKSILNDVSDYIIDRAKKDTQVVADALTQKTSDVLNNLSQGIPSIPDAIRDQYRAIKTKLLERIPPEKDPKLEASINEFMDQVDDMFHELEQGDPNLGLSASHAIDETIDQDADEPDYEDEPNVEIDEFDYEGYEEQRCQDGIEKAERDFVREHDNLDPVEVVNQLPDMGDGNAQSVAIENPEPTQTANTPKPAKLKAVSIEDALSYMSRRDDGAKAQDGKGYNLNDTGIGKRLTAQLDRGEALDSAQAQDALAMLKKYHKQFADGGIKLPIWKSVQTQYSEPAYSAIDQRAIFTRQQERLDATMPPGQQQAVLKAVYKVHALNMPEQNYPVQPGRYELELPTGSKLVNQLDDLGVNNLSIEKNEERILLGGVTMPGNYTPATTIANAMPELRQLRTFLTGDLKLSSEPVDAIPLNQPLPTPANKKDASESAESVDADAEEKPYTITPTKTEYKIIPGRMATEPEPEKKPAISRGGR